MGYKTPSWLGEEAYGASDGSVSLSWTSAQSSFQAGDLFILCLECRGGQEPTDNTGMTDWTFVQSYQSGDGTNYAGGAVFVHRYDGATLPTISSLPDYGNHQAWSLVGYRNIDRNIALADLAWVRTQDGTADTNFYSVQIADTDNWDGDAVTGATSGRPYAFVILNAGSEPWGGGVPGTTYTPTRFTNVNTVRTTPHSNGSGGTLEVIRGSYDHTGATATMQGITTTTTALQNVSIAVLLPGHEYTDYTRSVSDGLTAADSTGRVQGFVRGLAQSLGIADALGSLASFTRAITDSAGLADVATRIQGRLRSVSDSVGFGESLGRLGVFGRGLADSATLGESLSQIKVLYRVIADALGLGEALTRSIGKYRSVVDNITFSESLGFLVAGIRAAIVVAVRALANIVASTSASADITAEVEAQSDIRSTIQKRSASVEITIEVEHLTDIEVDIA